MRPLPYCLERPYQILALSAWDGATVSMAPAGNTSCTVGGALHSKGTGSRVRHRLVSGPLVHVYVCIDIYIYIYTYIYMFLETDIYVYVCVYIYIYTSYKRDEMRGH